MARYHSFYLWVFFNNGQYFAIVQGFKAIFTHVHSIQGSALSEELAEQAVSQVTWALANNHKVESEEHYDFEVSSQKELIETFSSITEMLTLLLVTISSISLVVGVLVL